MHPERVPATPDLMALFCLIGGAVREAGKLHLLMQLLLIGTYCPLLGRALRTWMLAEELYATSEDEYEAFAKADGEGGCDEIRPGWMNRDGPVLLWRHVTRFGDALLIPIQWVWTPRVVRRAEPGPNWSPVWQLFALSYFLFFADGLADESNCAYFVTIS